MYVCECIHYPTCAMQDRFKATAFEQDCVLLWCTLVCSYTFPLHLICVLFFRSFFWHVFLKNQACRRQIRVWCHGTISNGSYKILLLTCHHFNNNRTFVLQSWPVVMTASASAMGGRGFNSHHDQTPTGSLKNGVCAGPIAAICHLFSRALDWP